MFNCTTDKYHRLYARWLSKPGDLLDYAKMVPEDTVLDLCGGSGAAALAAVSRGAKDVHLLDLNPRFRHPRVTTVKGRAEDAPALVGRDFSLVVCRQALGYLDPYKLAPAVYDVLAPKGRFVLNNFLKPRWGIKWYRFQGIRYLEIFGYFLDHVVHIQAAPSIGVDVTHFRWHKHKDIINAFLPWFHVEFERSGKSIRYLCRRKNPAVSKVGS